MARDICTVNVTFKVWPAPFNRIGLVVAFVWFKFTGKAPMWCVGRITVKP